MRPIAMLALLVLLGCDEEGVLSKNGLLPDVDGRGDTDVVPDNIPRDTGGTTPDGVDPGPWIDPGVLDPPDGVDSGGDTGGETDTDDGAGDTDGLPDETDTDGGGGGTDGLPSDSGSLGETDPGETDGWTGETDTLPGETDTLPGETDTLPGETDGWTGETDTQPGETDTLPGETDTLPGETDTLPGETDGWTDETDGWPGESDTYVLDTDSWPVDTYTWSDSDLPYDTDGEIEERDCVIATQVSGWLDQFQTPLDGKVVFCHRTSLGNWTIVDASISACRAHAYHLLDQFPSSLCDS